MPGKSTVAAILQRRLGTPLFEFGWIPEFRGIGTRVTSHEEDEALAFENLTLVLKNDARHGFANIIVTDLEGKARWAAGSSGASGSRRVAVVGAELAEQFGGGLVGDAEAGAERVAGDRLPVPVLVLGGGPPRRCEHRGRPRQPPGGDGAPLVALARRYV